jgi:general secretion pathway protein G
MTLRGILAASVGLVLLTACSGGTPSTSDARIYFEEQLHSQVNGKAMVLDFKKTDGLKSIKDGVETYEMDFVASTNMPGSFWGEKDTYRGQVVFIRSEKGWRPTQANAASDAETAARDRQERERSMRAKAKQGLRLLEASLNLYKLDNFTYPSNEQGLRALVTEPTTEPRARNWKPNGYVHEVNLKDPWGNDYHYESPGKHGDIDIYTLGADNKPGGDRLDEDIGNWEIDG